MPHLPHDHRPVARRVYPLCCAIALASAATLLMPARARAQHGNTAVAASTPVAPKEGTQFDFLVGQWEVTAKPKAVTLAQRIHGVPKVVGTWKAWRALDGWGVEDEVRLTDGSGNPLLLSHAVRYFDAAAHRWSVNTIDVYKNIRAQSSADWRNGEMQVSGSGTDENGKAYLSRATFSKITPAAFSYRIDRSFDGGKTWTEGVTTMDARRVAATAPR
jgi:hypothetical protein